MEVETEIYLRRIMDLEHREHLLIKQLETGDYRDILTLRVVNILINTLRLETW